jgi:integrase
LKNITRGHFWPLLAAAKLPRIRVYDLRHTHATLQLGAGVPVHVVSQRLGHASAKMTLDVYANYLPDQHEDALVRYRNYLILEA